MWAEQTIGFSGKIGGHFVNWYPTASGRGHTGDDSGRITGGPAFNVRSVEVSRYRTEWDPQGRTEGTRVSTERDVSVGFVAGAGIESAIGRLRLTLDGRMTLWSRDDALNLGGGDIEGKPQAAVLFGIGF